MRKFLSILLCLCLIASSFVIAPYTSAAAEDYYDSSANYFTYLPNTILGDATSKTPEADTAEAHTAGGSSVHFTEMHGRVAAIKLNNVEVGKAYKFTVWVKGTPTHNRNPETYDVISGIYAKGASIDANGAVSNPISSVATVSYIADTDWHKISIGFTADSTDLYFAMRVWCGYNIWLDDAALEDGYYESATNYQCYVANNTLGGTANGPAPTVDTSEAHTPIDSSIKFKEMHGKVAAVKLNNIEVGKSYKLSLWYKGTADATIRPSSPSYDIYTPGIYSAGTVVGANGALSNAISSVADISFIADTDWRQLTITFTATSDDLYFATRIWCGDNLWLDDITLTQIEKEYDYKVYDYENGFFNASFPSSSIVSNASANIVSEETENPISGNSSYKYLWGATGVQWAFLTPKTAENQLIKGASYRVSGKYSVHQVNPAVISLNFGAAEALYKTHLADYSTAKIPLYENTYTSGQVYTFSGKITTVDAGYPAMHTYTNGDYTTDYILFDDIVYSQIIDSVLASSADSAMGSATVVNKAGYEDFAKNETAVFTATANKGHYFVGWYNKNGELVSESETYETAVYTDTNLTAEFAEFENFVEISFNTNGGSEIPSISDGAGAKISMPTNPTKEGFVFAGWYTDADCVNRFTKTTFPAVNTTLYAKWIIGSYQDFENYSGTPTGSFTVMTDGENAYAGNGYVKYSATAANGDSRVMISQNSNETVKAFASPGEQLTVSFKYKLVSGSANFHMNSSTQTTNCWAVKASPNNSNVYLNAYKYMKVELKNVSDEWQELTTTFTLNDETYMAEYGATLDDFLYSFMFFASTEASEFYIDDVMIYKTVNIPVNYSTEAIRLESTNQNKPLSAVMFGDSVSFKALMDSSVTATITYGDKVLTPENGIYTIDRVNSTDELKVVASGVSAAQNHAPGVGLGGEDLTKYDSDLYMNKVWEGDTVYHEAVMFVNSSDGTVQTTKKLLYPIDDIISVRNDDLNVWYVKGVDFKVEDGKLVWLPGGKCPIWTKPLVVPQNTEDDYKDPALSTGGSTDAAGYYTTDDTNGLYLIYDGYHEDATLYVTYKHSSTWNDLGESGYTPKSPKNQSYDMQKFYNKLATNNDINVLVYGDSVATGCASTGANVNYDLFGSDGSVMARSNGSGIKAPTFFEQATNELVKKYGNNNKVNYYNIALGGMGSAWGAENLTSRVGYMNAYYNETITPDIIYVKFAANDIRLSPDAYKTNMSSIVAQFKELYPDATIVLVSGKINNEKTYVYGDNHNNVLAHEQVLAEIADANLNCVAVKTTSVWADILNSKDYEDYLSNNINHANDFWAMVTSQIVVGTLSKDNSANGVTTMYNSAAALRSAANSTTGKNGLRVYNEIKRDWIQSANIVEFGSIAIFSENLGEELTLQVSGAKKGVAYKKGQTAAILWESTDGVFVFTSYLTNIKSYDKDIVVRSYAIDAEGNVYYGDECVVSVFAVANAMDNGNSLDGNAPSENDVNAFAQFVTAENKQNYLDWCLANNRTKGELFDNLYN